MIQVGSYHNLSAEALRRIKPYAEKLAEREITPECPITPVTEEQALLRKIGRIVFSDTVTIPAGINLIPMKQGDTSSQATYIPMTQAQIESRRNEFAEIHARQMSMLSSIFRQIEVLRTNDASVFES